MRIKTSELEGLALDWAVAQIDPMCNGLSWEKVPGGKVGFAVISGEKTPCAFLSNGSRISERIRLRRDGVQAYSPSTDWSQGGPLIDQHEITVDPSRSGPWSAANGSGNWVEGDTPLISACRAIVAAKLGDEVEVPDELL